MKKLICFILILCVIPLSAMAIEAKDIINDWNAKTIIFPAPKLSMDQFSNNVFTGDGWKVAFHEEYGKISSFGIFAKNADDFIPLCVVAGIMMVRDYEVSELTTFVGKLTSLYFLLKSGEEIIPATFGMYIFTIDQTNDGFFFTITGL